MENSWEIGFAILHHIALCGISRSCICYNQLAFVLAGAFSDWRLHRWFFSCLTTPLKNLTLHLDLCAGFLRLNSQHPFFYDLGFFTQSNQLSLTQIHGPTFEKKKDAQTQLNACQDISVSV
jgi:hypothetical protein